MRVGFLPTPNREKEKEYVLRFNRKLLIVNDLDARVGIGWQMPYFQGKTTPLPELFQ